MNMNTLFKKSDEQLTEKLLRDTGSCFTHELQKKKMRQKRMDNPKKNAL